MSESVSHLCCHSSANHQLAGGLHSNEHLQNADVHCLPQQSAASELLAILQRHVIKEKIDGSP